MKHIIIADDDPGIQDALKMILDRAGYKTTVFNRADPLLNDEFEEPDVFLVDRHLENADGLDVCRHLKQRENRQTPLIIFSASGQVNKLAMAAGADEFLEKPFKIKTLLDMIEKLTH